MNVSAHMPLKRRRLWFQSLIVLSLVMICSVAILVAPLFQRRNRVVPPMCRSRQTTPAPRVWAFRQDPALATIIYFPLKLAFAIGGEWWADWPMGFREAVNKRRKIFGSPVCMAPISSRLTT